MSISRIGAYLVTVNASRYARSENRFPKDYWNSPIAGYNNRNLKKPITDSLT